MPKQSKSIEAQITPGARARFCRLCEEAMREGRHEGEGGIGTLGEKRLHAVIKRYLAADEDLHEVGVRDTRYVSDVRVGQDVYEVQTGSFYPMRKKIAYYLEKTDCTVTVVHPLPVEKWVTWIDPETGDITSRKKSPKHASAVDLLPQLYSLLPHLGHPRLHFRVLLIAAEDFRLLDGWSQDRKRGSRRYERIPLDLLGEMEFSTPDDFKTLLPATLPSPFTVRELMRETHLRSRPAYAAAHALEAMGVITAAPPIRRAMAFLKK